MQNSIILYSQPTCGMCKTIHLLLKQKGIEYESVQDLTVMQAAGITHTPTLVVNNVVLDNKDSIIYFIKTGKLPETSSSTDSCASCEVK